MEIDYFTLKETYGCMETDALLQLHSSGTLTDEAYEALESELINRSVPIPDRPGIESKRDEHQSRVRKHRTLWAKGFALIGIVIPIICLALDFEPLGLMRVCELCWPTGFLLFAMEGHFYLPIVLISITLNSGVWAGFGWLIGYGTSGRIEYKL
jgi:hypothetical protein